MSDVSKTRAVPGQLFLKTGPGRKIEVDHRAGPVWAGPGRAGPPKNRPGCTSALM